VVSGFGGVSRALADSSPDIDDSLMTIPLLLAAIEAR
jgi:hypothetical protein